MATQADDQATEPSSSAAESPTPAPAPAPSSTHRSINDASKCTHLTMTRDREHAIANWIENNRDGLKNDGGIDCALCLLVKPGRRSPEKRADRLSFLEEITAEQMYTYSPAQIATILRQRWNLWGVLWQYHKARQAARLAQNVHHPSGSHDGSQSTPPSGTSSPADTKPWIPRGNEGCRVQYCHHCRPSCRWRSFLSLDGILNGDIPPTAAIGFGFHKAKGKPVADAELVKHIGLRAVPLPRRRGQPHTDSSSSLGSPSTLDLSDFADDELDDEN
ncbi:hypothetical protein F4859DRAFT_510713 [Xylaria cf. heliscus]|nr:hypothetical protein F4859DRAFT_510713 [Xylaria cf. heliscus]